MLIFRKRIIQAVSRGPEAIFAMHCLERDKRRSARVNNKRCVCVYEKIIMC